jgi:benzylsuccinate CoA-transferase BbsF subunit
LQAAGVEAVPVQDFADVHTDPQLRHRDHYVRMTHPFIGDGDYERNGFRLSDGDGGYERSAPTLGQDNARVLGEILGLSEEEQAELAEAGTLS